jgi:hypothetical protein
MVRVLVVALVLAIASLVASPAADAQRGATKRKPKPTIERATTKRPAPGPRRVTLRKGLGGRRGASKIARDHVAAVEQRIAELDAVSAELATIEAEIRSLDGGDRPIEVRQPAREIVFAEVSPERRELLATQRRQANDRLGRWRTTATALQRTARALRAALATAARSTGPRRRALGARLDRLVLDVARRLPDRHEALALLRQVIERPGVDRATRRQALAVAADLYVAQLGEDLTAFGLSSEQTTYVQRYDEDGTAYAWGRPRDMYAISDPRAIARMRVRVGWKPPWPSARRAEIARLEQALIAVIGAGEPELVLKR